MTDLPPKARILSTGLYTPPHSVSNGELVEAYNAWVDDWNARHPENPKDKSSAEFIEKASGIKSRYVMEKEGMLDPTRMRPNFAPRGDDELSMMAEMAVSAARDAMRAADLGPEDISAVVCAASNMPRAYPALAVEIQEALGVEGFGFDMNVACASAAFGIQTAMGHIFNGSGNVLVVNPEVCTAHINFRDRDGHFIFGDVATATIVGPAEGEGTPGQFDILDTRLMTKFSNNIRNNFGFLNVPSDEVIDWEDPDTLKLFKQNGRAVFREVVPMVAELITGHLGDLGMAPDDLKRMWLHQANLNMNVLIAKKVLGREATAEENPTVLDEYANTSSAGSIIAFHKHRGDLGSGDLGVICGFGGGYSAGTVIVRAA